MQKVLRDCLLCRGRNVKPGEQIMADCQQNACRCHANPFAYTGVDYFGSMLIWQGRSTVKRYGCLFTSLATCAIHLEVVCDLTSDAFINALCRFISQKWEVLHIYSHNGTNFAGAERIIQEAIKTWSHHKIEEFLQQREIQWSFNPPTASHIGGTWEHKSVRCILISLLGERTYFRPIIACQKWYHERRWMILFCLSRCNTMLSEVNWKNNQHVPGCTWHRLKCHGEDLQP